MSRKSVLLIIAFAIVAFLGVLAWSPWNAWRYRGDGRFSDGGFFSYPRYVATFPDMPLYEPGEKRFHFQGLPGGASLEFSFPRVRVSIQLHPTRPQFGR